MEKLLLTKLQLDGVGTAETISGSDIGSRFPCDFLLKFGKKKARLFEAFVLMRGQNNGMFIMGD